MVEAVSEELRRREAFEPYVGRTFVVEGAETVPLVLSAVEAGPPSPHGEPFILVLRGPKPGPVLVEGLRTCRIQDGPTCELYIMPIHTPAPDRQEYQVVFG